MSNMNVINYLKSGKTFTDLENELGIIVKNYDNKLFVLNYDQIESPKYHPIVKECRGLIIDKDYNVVCRPFDRFYNHGEYDPENKEAYEVDFKNVKVFDKLDGSLIKIYHHDNNWYCATRGTAFAESDVNGWPITFKGLVYRALDVQNDGSFNHLCNAYLEKDLTHLFEVTARENRVVTRYEGTNLHYLASRAKDGTYVDLSYKMEFFGAKLPKVHDLSTIESCIKASEELSDLKEGYVLYQDGIPKVKIKSPAYVAVHHIRGTGLSEKRIIDLVIINEHEEYLTYFPEDKEYFDPYIDAYKSLFEDINTSWEKYKDIENRKEFAIAIKDLKCKVILFSLKNDNTITALDIFNSMLNSPRHELLKKYVEK